MAELMSRWNSEGATPPEEARILSEDKVETRPQNAHFTEARRFLLDSPSYGALVRKIKRRFRYGPSPGMRKEIRGNIVPALPSTSCHADFYIPWQPKPFLETDAYIVGESQNLANVLTVTKARPSGAGDHLQGLHQRDLGRRRRGTIELL